MEGLAVSSAFGPKNEHFVVLFDLSLNSVKTNVLFFTHLEEKPYLGTTMNRSVYSM